MQVEWYETGSSTAYPAANEYAPYSASAAPSGAEYGSFEDEPPLLEGTASPAEACIWCTLCLPVSIRLVPPFSCSKPVCTCLSNVESTTELGFLSLAAYCCATTVVSIIAACTWLCSVRTTITCISTSPAELGIDLGGTLQRVLQRAHGAATYS